MRTQFFLALFIAAGSVWLFLSSVINPTARIPIIVCVLMIMLLSFCIVRLSWKELVARNREAKILSECLDDIHKIMDEQEKQREILLEEQSELKNTCK